MTADEMIYLRGELDRLKCRRMTFGPYRGRALDGICTCYLESLLRWDRLSPRLAAVIRDTLRGRVEAYRADRHAQQAALGPHLGKAVRKGRSPEG